jgi:glycosyltransferase involved in cell wall biosynthesis
MSHKLFIASGIFHPEPGGPATYLYEILPHLQAHGWDVRLLSFAEAANMGGEYPYSVTRIPRRALPLRMIDYARAARPLLEWADVTYVHTLGLPLIGGRSPRAVKIVGDVAWERAVRKKWIASTEDIDVFQTKRYGWQVTLNKFSRAHEAARMDAVIVPSEYLKRMVVGWGVDPTKVQVIYNALPPVKETAQPMSQLEARTRLNLPNAPTILSVGRILPWKGVDHLITAISRIKDVRLIVAGDGDQLPMLKAQTERLGVADRVLFLGRVSRDQVDVYMQAADYTALYSGYEGLSHTLLESLRAGTPVIASNKGGNPEVVQDGINGLLAPYVDVDALTETIRRAFGAGMREKLAANSQVGMARFDFGRLVEETNFALKSLTEKT